MTVSKIMPPFNGIRKKLSKSQEKYFLYQKMLIKFQKIIIEYLKNMKTCAPTGATVIGCKCYCVQLVLGATVFHLLKTDVIFKQISNLHFSLIL